ncbi:metalloregulator ArsR/SmtB family transcription factor [Comamonas nitrativorans]|uniref:Metalloregulator ArsR/SmtB family transcription factor n=1 Tax=Comamonas nitrativorans TaxID=108437 RepID=A0ABV9GVK2_9BURK
MTSPIAPAAAPIDLDVMRSHASQVVVILKLLGNADRLLLLCQLALQERTVGDLEQLTGVTQPTLSQQLGILRREGVVATRREGKFIWYRLEDARILQLIQTMYGLYCPQ